MKLTIKNIPTNDPKVYELITSGNCLGLFQIESPLTTLWSRRLKPKCLEYLAALLSVVRPGVLQSKVDDGRTMIEVYRARVNNEEEWVYEHPTLEPILKTTASILCIEENTLVSMADGTEKPIKDVKKFDRVHSVDLENNTVVAQECHGCEPTRDGNGMKITLANNYEIVVTPDHMILTNVGYKTAESLDKENDLVGIAISTPTEPSNYELMEWLGDAQDVAYLIGHLIGDGCMSPSTTGITIAAGSEESADKLIKWINAKLPKIQIRKYFSLRCWYLGIYCNDRAENYLFKNKKTRKTALHRDLDDLGLFSKAIHKRIPEIIFKSNPEIRRALLAGLYDADGFSGRVEKGGTQVTSYCSSSPGLIADIRRMLALDGISTFIDNVGNHVYVTNTQLFNDLITPYCLLKKPVGNLSSGDRATFVSRSILADAIKNSPLNKTQFAKEYGISDSTVIKTNRKFISYYTAKKLGVDLGDIRFIRIKKTEIVPDCQFYGMSVSNTNNLIGNGIIIKNCYQEQMIQITEQITNFTPVERHRLLKGVSKKNQEEIAAIKELFINSAIERGVVTKEVATRIYESFEASGRYLFNASHAVAYSKITEVTAYLKTHHPLAFFTGWLSQSPKEDIKALVRNARGMGINVICPDIRYPHRKFKPLDDNTIRFGFGSIVGCGASQLQKIKTAIKEIERVSKKGIAQLSWFEFLVYGFSATNIFSTDAAVKKEDLEARKNLSKSLIANLIKSGALSCFGLPRNTLMHELNQFKQLKDGEIKWLLDNINKYENLVSALRDAARLRKEGGGCFNQDRVLVVRSIVSLLENPPIRITDTIHDLNKYERDLLNVSLSAHSLDQYDCIEADTTIKEYLEGKHQDIYAIKCEISRLKDVECKRGKSAGKMMAFLSIEDSTGVLDEVLAFPANWKQICDNDLNYEGAQMLVWGRRDPKGSFIIEAIKPLSLI